MLGAVVLLAGVAAAMVWERHRGAARGAKAAYLGMKRGLPGAREAHRNARRRAWTTTALMLAALAVACYVLVQVSASSR